MNEEWVSLKKMSPLTSIAQGLIAVEIYCRTKAPFYSYPSINHSRATEKPWQRSPARTHIPPTTASTGEEEDQSKTEREMGGIHTTKSLQRKPAINCSKKGRTYFRPNAFRFVLMMSCRTFCMSRFSQPMNK